MSEEERIANTAKPLADPKEHPEQHAALHTAQQGDSEPEAPQEEGLLAHEEHSDEEGAFGTS